MFTYHLDFECAQRMSMVRSVQFHVPIQKTRIAQSSCVGIMYVDKQKAFAHAILSKRGAKLPRARSTSTSSTTASTLPPPSRLIFRTRRGRYQDCLMRCLSHTQCASALAERVMMSRGSCTSSAPRLSASRCSPDTWYTHPCCQLSCVSGSWCSRHLSAGSVQEVKS